MSPSHKNITLNIAGHEFNITGTYYSGDPGQPYGNQGTGFAPDPPCFEIIAIHYKDVEISDLLNDLKYNNEFLLSLLQTAALDECINS